MKKIFTFLMVALFSATMFADVARIYCKVEADWWNYEYSNRTVVGAYLFGGSEGELAPWPGTMMTKAEGENYVWVIEVDTAKYKKIIFNRCSQSGEFKGVQTADLTIPADKDLYTITKETYEWGVDPTTLKDEDGEWGVYVAPAPKEPVSVAIAGEFNEWSPSANVLELASDKKSASGKINLTKAGDYKFKIVLDNKDWVCKMAGVFELKRTYNGVEGVVHSGGQDDNFSLNADIPGEYTFTWTFLNDSIGIDFPAWVDPELEDGYYVIGLDGWKLYNVDPATKFVPSVDPERAGQQELLGITLKEGDEFKVVEVKDKKLGAWYGSGGKTVGEGNFVVTDLFDGVCDIYFNPTLQNDWNGYIWVEKNKATAVDNTATTVKAVKTLENGMLIIEKNGVRYTVMGQAIK